jgi:hypothetical protein
MSLTSQIWKPATSSRGFGEWPVDDRAVVTIDGDSLGLGAGFEAGPGDQHARLDQFLDEPVHRREGLLRGWHALFAGLGGFPQHHHTHRLSPLFEPPFGVSSGRRMSRSERDIMPQIFSQTTLFPTSTLLSLTLLYD